VSIFEQTIVVQVASLCVACIGLGVWIYFIIVQPHWRLLAIAPMWYLLCIAAFYAAIIVIEPEGGDPLFVMLSAALRLNSVLLVLGSPFVIVYIIREIEKDKVSGTSLWKT
jgi:hypothetical protein